MSLGLGLEVYEELEDLVKAVPDIFDFSQELVESKFKEGNITDEEEQKEIDKINKIMHDNNLTNVEEALIDPEVRLEFINFIMGDDDNDTDNIVEWAWQKVQSHMPTAIVDDKFNTAWNYIKHYPAIKKEMVDEMRRVGFIPKSNPFCVMGKMDKGGVSKEDAKKKCIDEGKLNPMNAIAFEKRYHFEG